MAVFSTAMVWEVRTTGSNTNGGGFKEGAVGTDRSQSNTPWASGNNGVTNTSAGFSAVTYTFTSIDIGNTIYLIGSGVTTGRYEIISVSGGIATLNVNPGSGRTNLTWRLGGAVTSAGTITPIMVAGNTIWVKAGTYTISTTSVNVTDGPMLILGGTLGTLHSSLRGYGTVRGDDAARPIFSVAVGSIATLNIVEVANPGGANIDNIEIDGTSQTGIRGIHSNDPAVRVTRCHVRNCTATGIDITQGQISRCTATGCSITSPAILALHAMECESYNNSVSGFRSLTSGILIRCISSGNTGYGFIINVINVNIDHCVAYQNTSDGFNLNSDGGRQTHLGNCIAENNGGWGYGTNDVSQGVVLHYCAGNNNTSGNYNATNIRADNIRGFMSFTGAAASVFVDAPNGDFALNDNATRGALLLGVGYPGLMPRGTTTGYADIGVVQTSNPSSQKIVIIPRYLPYFA
jgi:hypothetical protein